MILSATQVCLSECARLGDQLVSLPILLCRETVKVPPGEDRHEWIAMHSEHAAATVVAKGDRGPTRSLCAALHFFEMVNAIKETLEV